MYLYLDVFGRELYAQCTLVNEFMIMAQTVALFFFFDIIAKYICNYNKDCKGSQTWCLLSAKTAVTRAITLNKWEGIWIDKPDWMGWSITHEGFCSDLVAAEPLGILTGFVCVCVWCGLPVLRPEPIITEGLFSPLYWIGCFFFFITISIWLNVFIPCSWAIKKSFFFQLQKPFATLQAEPQVNDDARSCPRRLQ